MIDRLLKVLANRRLMRPLFFLYAAVLFTGTHWPALELPFPGRSDLVVHFTILGLWTVTLYLSGLCGPLSSWRAVAIAQTCGVLYGAVDEGLQAIPFIHRTAAFDDYSFDVGGVMVGSFITMWLLGRFARREQQSR